MRKVRKGIIHKLLRRFGSAATKRRIWDEEFASGSWEYLDRTEGDPIYRYLAKYCRGGDLLDLGCGAGNTGNELDRAAYRRYVGVDVSVEAVHRAIDRSGSCGRADKNTYVADDIERYTPQGTYSVILFRESIFYVPLHRIGGMLKQLSGYLCSDGVVIVRMCDRRRYARIVELIKRNFAVREEFFPEGEQSIILVFR